MHLNAIHAEFFGTPLDSRQSAVGSWQLAFASAALLAAADRPAGLPDSRLAAA